MGNPTPPQLPRQLFDRDLLHAHQKRTIDQVINPPMMASNFKLDGEPVVDDIPETSLDEYVPAATTDAEHLYGRSIGTYAGTDVWFDPAREWFVASDCTRIAPASAVTGATDLAAACARFAASRLAPDL